MQRVEGARGWDGWKSRSSQQQVVIGAGRNAGKTPLLIAWQMCPFPPGTPASSSDPSEDLVPWSQVSSKTSNSDLMLQEKPSPRSALSISQELAFWVEAGGI